MSNIFDGQKPNPVILYNKSIKKLADRPNRSAELGGNGLTAAGLKAQFDAAVEYLITLFNGLIDLMKGSTSAANIGAVDGETITTIQAYLDYCKAEINHIKTAIGYDEDTNISELITALSEAVDAIETALSNKVDKVEGKSLSTNDFTDILKAAYDAAVTASHSHTNKAILDNMTAAFTAEDKEKLAIASTTQYVDQSVAAAQMAVLARQPSITVIGFSASAGNNTLHLAAGSDLNYIVSKGDGTIPAAYTSGGNKTLNYAYAGYYYILISGTFNGFNVNSASSGGEKYIEVYIGTNCPMADNSFYGCYNLFKLEFSLNWTGAIGNSALRGCSSLVALYLSQYTQSLGNYVCSGCSKLETVLWSPSLVSVGLNAFALCAFTYVDLSPCILLQTLGYNAFYAQNKLKKIILPSTIETIESGALFCNSLREIEFKHTAALPAMSGTAFQCSLTDIICATASLAQTAKSALVTAGATLLDGYRLMPGGTLKGSATVLTTDWAADTTYEDYGYRAAVPVTGLTASHVGDVYFDDAADALGILKASGDQYNGGFYVYASAIPDITIVIVGYKFTEVV